MRGGIWAVDIAGQNQQASETHTASMRFITPGYFPSMGIPLKLGRGVEESDGATALPVAVVSESFVQRYWPGQNAIGRSFQIASGTRTVVGVAGNVRVRGLEARSEPQVYLSYKQMRDGNLVWYAPKDLAVRTTVNPTSLSAAIRAIVHDADPQQPVSDVQTLTEIVESNTASRQVQARVLGAFAAIAFLLAAVGIHGLLSFSVSQRTQEIGVRVALGATRTRVVRLVLGEGLAVATIGTATGLVIAAVGSRWLAPLLYKESPRDPLTFGGVAVVMLAVAVIAAAIPGLRAASVDPNVALRSDG
jgi:putative ABC transport system permease protein